MSDGSAQSDQLFPCLMLISLFINPSGIKTNSVKMHPLWKNHKHFLLVNYFVSQ